MDQPLPDAPALPVEADVPITWTTLGFDPSTDADGNLNGTIPSGVIIFAARTPEANGALGSVCEQISTSFAFEVAGRGHFAYAVDDDISLPERIFVPEGVTPMRTSAVLALPEFPPRCAPPSISQQALTNLAMGGRDAAVVDSPLDRFSLRGKAEEFERQAVKSKPLLGDLCLAGQATVWFAPPNAGKTLIVLKLLSDAVADKRITPDNVYYINADDSSEGFATKIRLMDDLGVHTLAPGYEGFDARMLPELFHAMADRKKATGVLVIIDTIKKVASLMDKTKASAFTHACRSAVMAGATIVGFAHTNKQPTASGKLQYGGTTDLRDDFDAAYIMGPMEIDGFNGDKVVAFENIKSRGSNVRSVAYVYADNEGISYPERLASVRRLDDEEMRGFRRIEEEKADADIIAAIETCIGASDFAKMALAKAVAQRAGISERAALRMIEKYTGTDPATAKWHFQRKERGAMIYALHPSPAAAPPAPT